MISLTTFWFSLNNTWDLQFPSIFCNFPSIKWGCQIQEITTWCQTYEVKVIYLNYLSFLFLSLNWERGLPLLVNSKIMTDVNGMGVNCKFYQKKKKNNNFNNLTFAYKLGKQNGIEIYISAKLVE